MALLNPYLQFDGTAREAMEAYRAVFGGTLEVSRFADFGGGEEAGDGVMHAQLSDTDLGFTLMAADAPPGMPAAGHNGTISLSGDEIDQLTGYWEKLAEGGQVHVPLEAQMWGDTFGQLTDRFGVGWMVNIAGGQG